MLDRLLQTQTDEIRDLKALVFATKHIVPIARAKFLMKTFSKDPENSSKNTKPTEELGE